MGAHLTRVKVGVVGAPGTGTISLGDPIRDPLNGDCLSIAEAGGANGTVYSYILIDGANFAEGEGPWTSSGNLLGRDANEKRWNGTNFVTGKLSLTSAAIVLLTPRAKDLVASGIPFTPAGTIAANTVQAAIEEVAAEANPLLQSGTVSAGATTLDITSGINSDHDRYEIHLYNAKPNATADLQMQTSSNGGATFDSGASDYLISSLGGASVAGSTGFLSNVYAPSEGYTGVVYLNRPSIAQPCSMRAVGQARLSAAANGFRGRDVAILRDASAIVNAVRFMFASTTFADCIWKLYAVKK